jgi:serine/threonine protein kinase
MGKVYLVHDGQLGREIALKVLLRHAGPGDQEAERVAAARFSREARITAQLQHPSITPVHELGRRADGSCYYTMKFVRGRTMADALKGMRSLDERLKLLPSFVSLCHAIAFAHSRGVIHRDIKPANVLLGDFGETVLADWGLAKFRGAGDVTGRFEPETCEVGGDDGLKTTLGTTLGTPAYMSPEQAEGLTGAVDERSDIYSLGAMLYEILTGRRPFSGDSAQEVLAQVRAGQVTRTHRTRLSNTWRSATRRWRAAGTGGLPPPRSWPNTSRTCACGDRGALWAAGCGAPCSRRRSFSRSASGSSTGSPTRPWPGGSRGSPRRVSTCGLACGIPLPESRRARSLGLPSAGAAPAPCTP